MGGPEEEEASELSCKRFLDGFNERRNEGIKQRRHGLAKVYSSSAGTRKYWKSLKRRVFSQVREQKSSVPGGL